MSFTTSLFLVNSPYLFKDKNIILFKSYTTYFIRALENMFSLSQRYSQIDPEFTLQNLLVLDEHNVFLSKVKKKNLAWG